jgi:hypothetical protein
MGKSTEVPAKRHDPNYIQLSGDVRKELGLQFKAACTLKQLNNSIIMPF